MAHFPAPVDPLDSKPPAPAPGLTRAGVALALIGVLVASVAGLLDAWTVSMGARWVGLLGLFLLGIARRSLTTWIMISMLVGAEIGYDFPAVGIGMRLFSQIFLKLIKTIVAPLIFATLVVASAIGVALSWGVAALERLLLPWRRR